MDLNKRKTYDVDLSLNRETKVIQSVLALTPTEKSTLEIKWPTIHFALRSLRTGAFSKCL